MRFNEEFNHTTVVLIAVADPLSGRARGLTLEINSAIMKR